MIIEETRILGIDPGYARLGFAFIAKNRSEKFPRLLHSGLVETKASQMHHNRLLIVYQTIDSLIKEYKPNYFAIETLFFFKNKKTAIQVAESRGVLLLMAALHNLIVAEFSPLQVKQALTGKGRAEKTEVQAMVKILLRLNQSPSQDDEADAMAVALTALHTQHRTSV